MGTTLERKRNPLRPYRRPMLRVLGCSYGGGRFLMGEATLYGFRCRGLGSGSNLNAEGETGGYRIQGLWFRGSGFRVPGSGFVVEGIVRGLKFRAYGLGSWI